MKITVTVDDPTTGRSDEGLSASWEHSESAGTKPFAQATDAGPPSLELVAAIEAVLGASPHSVRPVNGVAIDAGAALL